MPYISKDKRDYVDPFIDELHHAIVEMEMDDETNNTEGNVNYIITRLLMMVYGDKDSTSYRDINDVMGVLGSVKAEFYRKVAAPYEDQKEFESGPIIPFLDKGNEIIGTVDVMGPETD